MLRRQDCLAIPVLVPQVEKVAALLAVVQLPVEVEILLLAPAAAAAEERRRGAREVLQRLLQGEEQDPMGPSQ